MNNLEMATGAALTAPVADPKSSAHIGRPNNNNKTLMQKELSNYALA